MKKQLNRISEIKEEVKTAEKREAYYSAKFNLFRKTAHNESDKLKRERLKKLMWFYFHKSNEMAKLKQSLLQENNRVIMTIV